MMHDMWEQLNDPHYNAAASASLNSPHNAILVDCGADDCLGPGPPPEFRLPPPPRPPFLQALNGVYKCSEEPLPDIEMCSVLPAIFDPSLHISPSQTSTLICIFAVLLVFTVSLSSFVVWKHKRKVPGFMQCKAPRHAQQLGCGNTRENGRHDSPGSSSSSANSGQHANMMHQHDVTVCSSTSLYEDPNLHISRISTLMSNQQLYNQHSEAHLAKSLHYPSGYPMPHSPPIFVGSSPGPDPYRLHDNVYEELDQQQQQQQHRHHQNDGNTEDEHDNDEQCPSTSDAPSKHMHRHNLYRQITTALPADAAIATIYGERRSVGDLLDRTTSSERHSLLSTSSSSTTNTVQAGRSCLPNRATIFGTGHRQIRHQRQSVAAPEPAATNAQLHHTQPRQMRSPSHPPSYDVVVQPLEQQLYDAHSRTCERPSTSRFYRHPANSSAHILSAAPAYQHGQHHPAHYQLPAGSYAAALQHDVDVKRRNQLNTQLTQRMSTAAAAAVGISTIYQSTDPLLDTPATAAAAAAQAAYQRHYHQHLQQQHQQQQQHNYEQQQLRSRTNPRPDRRRSPAAASQPAEPLTAAAYGTYREPLHQQKRQQQHHHHHHQHSHQRSTQSTRLSTSQHQHACGSQYPSYISPAEFSSFRQQQQQQRSTSQQLPMPTTTSTTTTLPGPMSTDANVGNSSSLHQISNPISSRDSSFGSDSGYSHNTQNSHHHLVGLLASMKSDQVNAVADVAGDTPTVA